MLLTKKEEVNISVPIGAPELGIYMLSTVNFMIDDELGWRSLMNGFQMITLLVSVSQRAEAASPEAFVKWQLEVLASFTVSE